MTAGALLFLLRRRLRNRIRSGIRKLKQPRFLVAAVLAVAYLIFVLGTQLAAGSLKERGAGPSPISAIAPVGLLALAGVAWVFPRLGRHHPLRFSKADVELLFAQPIPRKALVIYALLSVQIYVLFSTVLFSLFFSRSFHPRVVLGWIVILNILHLHAVGIAFARQTPWEAGLRRWTLAWTPGLVLALGTGVSIVLARPDPGHLFSLDGMAELKRMTGTGGFTVLLAPFGAVTRILTDPGTFPGWALLVLVAHLAWILLQDAAFEEACVKGAEVRAARLEAWKQGKHFFWRKRPRGPVTRQPFRLAPTGPAIWAFVWKGLLSASRFWSVRNMAVILPAAAALGWGARVAEVRLLRLDMKVPIGIWIGGYALVIIFSFILGRSSQEGLGMTDSRSSLKSLPLPGRVVFAGSVMAEVAVYMAIVGIVWAALVGYLARLIAGDPIWLGLLLAVSLAGMGVLVALTSAVRLVTVLLLPFTAIRQTGPAGFGHNLATMLIRTLGMGLVLIAPGGMVGVALLFIGRSSLAPHVTILAGSVVAGVETVALIRMGGRLYDRFDSVTAT